MDAAGWIPNGHRARATRLSPPNIASFARRQALWPSTRWIPVEDPNHTLKQSVERPQRRHPALKVP